MNVIRQLYVLQFSFALSNTSGVVGFHIVATHTVRDLPVQGSKTSKLYLPPPRSACAFNNELMLHGIVFPLYDCTCNSDILN